MTLPGRGYNGVLNTLSSSPIKGKVGSVEGIICKAFNLVTTRFPHRDE